MQIRGLVRTLACGAALALTLGCSQEARAPEDTAATRTPLVLSKNWVRTALFTHDALVDNFGEAVSASSDRILVGAPNWQASGYAAGYTYVRAGLGWALEQQLDSDEIADQMGNSLALSGDTALLGAPGSNNGQGAAYVFVRTGGVWSLQTKLHASDGAAHALFGFSVALEGDTALVGAGSAGEAGQTGGLGVGAVYVYQRSGSTWAEQKLTNTTIGHFGVRVALSGERALVAGSDSVHAYARSNGVWGYDQQLTPANPPRIALSADRALVNGVTYERGPSSWQQGALIESASGGSLSLSGDTAVIGFFGVRVYERHGSEWPEERGIGASDVSSSTFAPRSVSVSGNVLAIGFAHDPYYEGNKQQFAVFEANLPCARDADCPDSSYCGALGLCLPRAVRGAPCSTQAGVGCHDDGCRVCEDLLICADGVCCNSACAGGCQACSVAAGALQDGVCRTLERGQPGKCQGGSVCNGSSGDCASCTDDAQCPLDTLYCAADGSCQPRKAPGSACDSGAGADCLNQGCRVCAGGNSGDRCFEGVCCDTLPADCAGCRACRAALTGAAEGVCAPVLAGTDPHDFCAADPAETCDHDGMCDGQGACRAISPKGRVCGDAVCENGVVAGLLCNGGHTCLQSSVGCAPFACSGNGCATSCESNAECAAGARCSPAHLCEPGGDGGLGDDAGSDAGEPPADAGEPAPGICPDCRASAGCGCRLGSSGESSGHFGLLGALALLALRRGRCRV